MHTFLSALPSPRAALKFGAVVLLGLLPVALSAQSIPPASLDAAALVRRAVQHRLDAARNHAPSRYLLRRTDERHDTVKIIIETKDGDVARLIASNGKPLSPDADKAELDRLDDLAQHPELQEKRRKSEQKDADRVTHLLGLLPDAFLYRMEGTVPCGADQCYRLSFTPNPNFTPPDLEANVFRGAAGEIWIDQAQERMTRLDAHFIADVDFGFGILGRINKGGTALIEQTDVGGHDWELTGMNIHVNGKALLVRSFGFHVNQQAGHYSPVPPTLGYRDAIQMLKKVDPSETPYTP